MRAFCALMLLLTACGTEEAPTAVPGDGSDPAIPSGTIRTDGNGSGQGGQGGTAGTGGEDGTGGSGGAGGATGACISDTDLESLSFVESGREVARQCVVSTCGSILNVDDYAVCVTRCVNLRIRGLSPECGACFGQASRCELENACTASCRINECSTQCLACWRTAGCLSELDDCTGLGDADCSL
jgi:hypothetical protein